MVFIATPDGVGMKLAEAELAKGAKVIDYSGDFRFNDAETYAEYARRIGREPAHTSPDLLPQAVYGLAELHRPRNQRQDRRLVGNPGCFAVSCMLGPRAGGEARAWWTSASLICDCKTGVSGAGKKPSPTFHYPARYDHMNAYKLAGHQHVMRDRARAGPAGRAGRCASRSPRRSCRSAAASCPASTAR